MLIYTLRADRKANERAIKGKIQTGIENTTSTLMSVFKSAKLTSTRLQETKSQRKAGGLLDYVSTQIFFIVL